MKTTILIITFALMISSQIFSQQHLEKQFKGYNNPDELVTLSANLPYSQAFQLLSKVSESLSGKRIVTTVESNDPINIDIENMPYDKALLVLVQMAGLTFEEKEDVIIVKRKNEPVIDRSSEKYAPIGEREVKINAIFFEMDANEVKERGIDWALLLSKPDLALSGLLGIDPTADDQSSSVETPPTFNLGGTGSWNSGGFFGEATAVFKFFENEQLGEVIASPNITVRDGQKGRIQVGSDFSIKQRDFAGNVIENFFSTGSIIEVTPHIYKEDGTDYVLLDIKVERSSFIPDQSTTEIRKTTAETQVLMFNGEETVIGGLYINEEVKIRTGIPFLKDLPWWFFGIRYLTGSDETRINKKELVILLKSELVPTIKERVLGVKTDTPIKDEVKRFRQDVKHYQFNQPSN